MSPIHLPANAKPDEAAACLREHGYVIIDSLVAAEDLDRIDAELATYYETGSFGSVSGNLSKRTGALIARSPTARKLIMNELVLGTIANCLPYLFQIGLTEMISLWPGAQAQFLHQDETTLGPYPFSKDYELMISTIWAISDFTEELGATRFVPGSHTFERGLQLTQADTVAAEMPRGSVLVFSGKLYHGGGENRAQKIRRAMNVDYISAWLRQMENQYLSCPPEIARTLPPDLLNLMGYQLTPHAVGRVGDWIDPLSFALGGSDRIDETKLGGGY